MKKLTVVIVSYNVCYYLEQCLNSVLKAARDIDHEIYVVDNASSDDTVSFISHRFSQQVNIIESQHNLGFARANNIAIKQTQSEYVLLLNPDTFIAEDTLQQVLDFMDSHPRAGGVGVKMHNADGTVAQESRRGLPTPWVSMLKMLGRSKRYYMSHLSWDEPGQIEVISGAFCMLRRKVLDQVGLLDEDFFMYGEDIDLSYRILKGGYENWYVPATMLHYKGESTKKSTYRYVHVFYQAMLIFFRKHYGHLSFLVTVPIRLAIYFRALIALIHMQYWRMRQYLGFSNRRGAETQYFFSGSQQMIEDCKLLAKRKGLQANFGNANDSINPNSCMVYDTGTFSFGQIISEAKKNADRKLLVGTYYKDSKTIISPKEIIR